MSRLRDRLVRMRGPLVTVAATALSLAGGAAESSPPAQLPAALASWVTIPAQTCQIGCVPGDAECSDNERPRHPVTIRRFLMMASEVTVSAFREYATVARKTLPGQPDWSGDDHPVVNVTWDDASNFCAWDGGRLPTEAEWECAARGGVDGRVYWWGDTYKAGLANDSNGFKQTGTRPVRSYPPNEYGLYDVTGNVWEWVSDWFDERAYEGSVAANPTGPAEGSTRIMRGGSWRPFPRVLRLSNRGRGLPERANYYVGFRCARDEKAI